MFQESSAYLFARATQSRQACRKLLKLANIISKSCYVIGDFVRFFAPTRTKDIEMELDEEFCSLVRSLVYQKEGELSEKRLKTERKIFEDSASKGWSIPPGHVRGAIDDLQEAAIRENQDVVWSAIEQTLEAFDPAFYPELGDDLYSLAESFFPESICEPHDVIQGMGFQRPFADKVQDQLRTQLELARHSSLNYLKTKIGLYVAKNRTNSQEVKSSLLASAPQAQWDLFICHASEDKGDFVSPLAAALLQKGISVWYDDFCIKWGDSIRRSIDRGLQSCKFGVVVFGCNPSPAPTEA